MATFVVGQPHSNTNSTGKYRVVNFKDWHNAVYGDGTPVKPVSEHDTYDEALAACTKLNKKERDSTE